MNNFQMRGIEIEIKCDLVETYSKLESWLFQLLAMYL